MKKMGVNQVLAVLAIFVTCGAQAKQTPPENRVSIEKARAAALHRFKGKIQGEELEFEGGKWIYSFDLKTPKDKLVHEIHVDAISGKVINSHTETASDEKKELQEEQSH
jgi:uncharacterized membrane protein YkoI